MLVKRNHLITICQATFSEIMTGSAVGSVLNFQLFGKNIRLDIIYFLYTFSQPRYDMFFRVEGRAETAAASLSSFRNLTNAEIERFKSRVFYGLQTHPGAE
jgi:hypothetical protein